MQNAPRTLTPQPRLAVPRPSRAPRPAPASQPAATPSLRGVPATENVDEVRHELDALARQCRALADLCDQTSRKLDAPTKPVSSAAENLCTVRDTLPEAVLEFEDLAPDVEEEDAPTSQWPRVDDAATWESPVVDPTRLAPAPSQVLVPCPSCGHRNGYHYRSCTVCGGGLAAVERPASPGDVYANAFNAMLDWFRRLDPRRPRWMEPEALAPRT